MTISCRHLRHNERIRMAGIWAGDTRRTLGHSAPAALHAAGAHYVASPRARLFGDPHARGTVPAPVPLFKIRGEARLRPHEMPSVAHRGARCVRGKHCIMTLCQRVAKNPSCWSCKIQSLMREYRRSGCDGAMQRWERHVDPTCAAGRGGPVRTTLSPAAK